MHERFLEPLDFIPLYGQIKRGTQGEREYRLRWPEVVGLTRKVLKRAKIEEQTGFDYGSRFLTRYNVLVTGLCLGGIAYSIIR